MSVEQVARDFITNMADKDKVMSQLTTDAMVDGGVLPQPIPAMDAFKIISGLSAAMPDIKFDVQKVTVDGNKATVNALWHGTQINSLSLPVPGLPTISPTGKKVSVKDTYVITVRGDKVAHMTVLSPDDGGIPAALAQLGVKLQAM